MNLTDTHCHLNLKDYRDDLSSVLDRAQAEGVNRILVPALDLNSSLEILNLIEAHEILYAAIGVHPNSGKTWQNDTLKHLQELAGHPKVVAIGEIGLDYYRDRTPRDLQKKILSKQLLLAGDCNLPVILHVRNASEEDRSCIQDLLGLIENWVEEKALLKKNPDFQPGVIHSFSGNLAESQRALQAGFYLGVTGPVTFKKAVGLREVVDQTDLSRLLIETDGPFLAPDPFRGKRNEPAHVRYIIDKISEVKDIPVEQAADQTAQNAACLFKWE